ncbi:TPA: morphogenetic protein [Klebsiella variicola]|nr:morphogenetic protein [Klebsiella variicola]HDK6721171.1 morphogenetic protein [Klebsiella variicola]
MKERGMIFNAEMVRAILDGRKTQTRRIMTVQPESSEFGLRYIAESSLAKEVGMYFWSQSDACGMKARSKPFACPYGKPGDRIWVRETWARYNIDQNSHDIAYRATTPADWPEEGHWRPSIHMPRWASRILLEITGVRVERLNAISQEDAQAEGMELTGWRPTYSDPDSGGEVMTPYDNFAELWSSIYGAENWQANPWVWVIEFKRVEGGAA